MDMDYDALKAAHRTSQLVKDPKGNPMNINLDTLVVAKNSATHFRALEILGAIKKNQIAGSADNDGSGVLAFKIIALPYMAQTAYWGMFDSSMRTPEYGLQCKESQGVQLEGPNIVFKTSEIQYKSTIMFDLGFNDYSGWVLSSSANA